MGVGAAFIKQGFPSALTFVAGQNEEALPERRDREVQAGLAIPPIRSRQRLGAKGSSRGIHEHLHGVDLFLRNDIILLVHVPQ